MQAKITIKMDKIDSFRKKINKIDKKISTLLKERLKIVNQIGELKSSKKLPVIDEEREKSILESFDSNYELEIFKKILKESRKQQS